MNRRELLCGLVAMPVASAFSSCTTPTQPVAQKAPRITTLKVVLDGSFAVVFERKNPSRITAFIPPDPEKMHEFYLNNFSKPLDNGQDPNRTYNFQLAPRGLEQNQAMRPYTDQCFRDFSKHTDLWKKEKYFVTLELPVPDVISFVPPPVAVMFKESHKRALMPLNHVLRYRVQNADDLQMLQEGKEPIKPLNDSDFANYQSEWCKDRKTGARSSHCRQMQEYSSDWFEENAVTYYFGVGRPSYEDTSPKTTAHALNFYNNVLLRSFPKAQPELQLSQVFGIAPGNYSDATAGSLVPAVWKPEMPPPHLVLASAAIDCKLGGANLTIP
jgi:hypothetical protein